MRHFLKTTTNLSLVVMLSFPSVAMAQTACGNGDFPCALADGAVVQDRIQLHELRIRRRNVRLNEVKRLIQQADRDVGLDLNQLEQERAKLERQIGDIENSLKREESDRDKSKQAKKQDSTVQSGKVERVQRERDAQAAAERRAAAKNQVETRAIKRAEAQAQAERRATKQAEAKAQAERQQLKEQRRAKRQAERARARAHSDAVDGDGGKAMRVETESLTDKDVRRSNEEFADSVTGKRQAARPKDDDGLSKFEKALILGLGAVVVGSVLNNGDEVKSHSGDRVVVEREGELRVLKDDDALLRRAGNNVKTETFDDGSIRSTVTKENGTRIVTIRGADGTVLRRLRVLPDGREFVLFDDTRAERDIVVSRLPPANPARQITSVVDEAELRAALQAQAASASGGAFSLRQIREIPQVRAIAPEIELDAVRFATGSAAIAPQQARSLARIGNTLHDLIEADPRIVLLIEGHTDAVGDASYNLALSDRRAETVARALSEYFDVPEENMIVQGYGESQLKVATPGAE